MKEGIFHWIGAVRWCVVLTGMCFCWGQDKKSTQTLLFENASWNNVFSGGLLLPPKKASSGFVAFTDGKIFTYFNNKGKVLFEKGVRCFKPSAFYVLENDLIALVCTDTSVILLNSSGEEMWRKKMGFAVTSLCQGGDGRLFVKGSENLACIDLAGRIKWRDATEKLADVPLAILNDGSLYCLLSDRGDEKSRVVRLTPFGQSLEVIEYDGVIVQALSVDAGVLLAFKSGEFGLASVKKNGGGQILDAKGNAIVAKCDVAWALKDSDGGETEVAEFVPLSSQVTALLAQGGGTLKVIIFYNDGGRVLYSFADASKNLGQLIVASGAMSGRGLFVADKTCATLYDITGSMSLTSLMPPSTDKIGDYNYAIYTGDDRLILFSPSWLAAGFKMANVPPSKKNGEQVPGLAGMLGKSDMIYDGFYEKVRYTGIDSTIINDEITGKLMHGEYGKEESEIFTHIFCAARRYADALMNGKAPKKTVEDKKIEAQMKPLYVTFARQLVLLGGKKANAYLAFLVENESEMGSLRAVFQEIPKNPYDADALILQAMARRVRDIPYNDASTLLLLCNAVDAICTKMGRRYYSYGINVLSEFMAQQYPDRIKDSARKYMHKFTE